MEKPYNQKIGWALVGYKSNLKLEDSSKLLEMLADEAFKEDKFILALQGNIQEHMISDISTIEQGYLLSRSTIKDFKPGDYGAIARIQDHELLFLPIELENEDENISGDINNM